MAARPPGGGGDEPLARLVGELDDVGFESSVADGDPLRVEVTHCPFLEVADGHRDVVCALHLGLMRGLLEDVAVEVTDLQPLVEPGLCVAHLAR